MDLKCHWLSEALAFVLTSSSSSSSSAALFPVGPSRSSSSSSSSSPENKGGVWPMRSMIFAHLSVWTLFPWLWAYTHTSVCRRTHTCTCTHVRAVALTGSVHPESWSPFLSTPATHLGWWAAAKLTVPRVSGGTFYVLRSDVNRQSAVPHSDQLVAVQALSWHLPSPSSSSSPTSSSSSSTSLSCSASSSSCHDVTQFHW